MKVIVNRITEYRLEILLTVLYSVIGFVLINIF